MRALSRRAAIGATTIALVFAAAGTSLAAVRSTRNEGGVAPSGLALPAPSARSGVEPAVPPTSDLFVPESESPPTSGSSGASPDTAGTAGAAAGQGSPGPAPAAGVPKSAASAGATEPAPRPAGRASAARSVVPTVSTLPPASGPTPTTSPVRSAATTCPPNEAKGALPVRGGPLQAVNFALRWPIAAGPVVLVPQPSAVRPGQAPVTIAGTTAPLWAVDGTSLTLTNPINITYTLQSGQEKATGGIRFTSVTGPDVSVTLPACRDASFVLHDVKKAVLQGSAVRIIGMVAPPGTSVTITPDGGTAFFRSSAVGTHKVTLLTATDAGAPDKVIEVAVIIA